MRVLVTGMSGTGKSSALAELARQGFEVVDTDECGWSEWSDEDGGYVWREDRNAGLLARSRNVPLFVSGTVSNQGKFYGDFDAVVLLSALADVLLGRIDERTTNPCGKRAAERELIVRHLAEVEPLLRAGAVRHRRFRSAARARFHARSPDRHQTARLHRPVAFPRLRCRRSTYHIHTAGASSPWPSAPRSCLPRSATPRSHGTPSCSRPPPTATRCGRRLCRPRPPCLRSSP
jgi:AAA domain